MGMSQFQPQTIMLLKFGWDYVTKKNPEILDEIFSELINDDLWKTYGIDEVNKIKQWITSTDVPFRAGWQLSGAKMPHVTVALAPSSEDVGRAVLGDYATTVEVPDTRTTLINTFVPASVNQRANGEDYCYTITLPTSLQSSRIVAGSVMVDANESEFSIDQITDTGFRFFAPITAAVDTSKIRVIGNSNKLQVVGETAFMEQMDILIEHAGDPSPVLWIYSIIKYILFRFKLMWEERGIQVHTFSAADFQRSDDKAGSGNQIFGRRLRLRGRVVDTWIQEDANPVDIMDYGLKLADINSDLTMDYETLGDE